MALGALHEAWAAAIGDQRQLVLVAGDAGIGKSRLAAEFTRTVHRDGAAVLYGRFDETGPGAYQPILEMLRGWSGGAALTGPAQRLGPRAADLAALLPELGSPAGSAIRADAGIERQRLFDALAALLAEIAAGAPLLLMIDDLQWADSPTLQLLRHLVRAPQPRRTMFLGTYREAEVGEDHPLTDLIASLRREGMLTQIPLEGLVHGEVGELVAALGAEAPADFVTDLERETEGNPFFVEEIVRHGGDLEDAGVPEGVREVTSRRIARLPASAREAMQVACVIGGEFDFGLLEALGPLSGDELVSALDEAVAAGVLKEVDGRVGRYAFAHALVRATLYDGLSSLRRARLHSRVGETILARHQDDLDPWLPQLARHFVRAAPVEGPARAIDFALAAGRRADRLLAWEEAAQHYRGALQARQATSPRDRTAGRAPARARRVRGAGGAGGGAGRVRGRARRGPRARRRGAAGPCRARRGRAVVDARARGPRGRRGARGGARRARRGGLAVARAPARPALARALLRGPARAAARAQRGGGRDRAADRRRRRRWRPRSTRATTSCGGRRTSTSGSRWPPSCAGSPPTRATWSSSSRAPAGRWSTCSSSATWRAPTSRSTPPRRWPRSSSGRSTCGGPRCSAARARSSTASSPRPSGWRARRSRSASAGHAENALHYYAMAMFNIRREQGRLGEVEDAVARFIEMYPAIPAWRCTQALMHLELRRLDAAREAFEAVAAPGFDALPRDANWLIALTLAAEVCAELGDAARARELAGLLAPHGGRNVLVGRAASCNGCASRQLGMLASVLRDWDEAELRFFEAREMHVRMGARPFLARTELAWAEMLLARGEPGDDAAARERLAEAVVIADALGMVAVAERARALVAGGEPVRSRA